MNDPVLFATFVQNVLGVGTARVRNEITNFVNTFGSLLSISDSEIDEFVKSTHNSNSGRANNARILISSNVPTALKALSFELRDRNICDALPGAAILGALNNAQLNLMRRNRAEAIEHQKRRDNLTHHAMDVPTLKENNYEEFELAFKAAVRRQDSMHGSISLDYLLRDNDVGNYNALWANRAEKLSNCVTLRGQAFATDNETLYNLLVQYVGIDKGSGSNIVTRHKRNKDGRACYIELKSHYKTDAHEQTKATAASNSIKNAVYTGNRRFSIEDYYSLMAKAFNTLEDAGAVYALTEPQKVNSFESGLKENIAVSYSIQARREWENLPVPDQTFETYYTSFSALYTRHNSLTRTYNNRNSNYRISEVNTRGRGRGRGRGNRAGRGKGRGRGRNARYNPYQLARQYGKFEPEARVYPKEQWSHLTPEQKKQVMDKKIDAQWIDGSTPPNGYVLDQSGRAVVDQGLVSVFRSQIALIQGEASAAGNQQSIVPLPPTPQTQAPIPPMVTTGTASESAGNNFGRQGSRQRQASDQSSVSSVTVNGRPYSGAIFDMNGNRIA